MEKKELILNDQIVAEAVAKHEAEMEDLQKPVTREDAELFVKSLDDWDIGRVIPKGTIVGTVNFASKKGARQAYGFVSNPTGDIFVPPRLMEGRKDGERVAVLVEYDPRPHAVRMVDVWKYVSWHEDEILEKATAELKAKRERELKWAMSKDPTDGWEEYKAKAKALGFTLVEIKRVTNSFNYGGRGEDTYVFAAEDREKLNGTTAEQLLTALGGRHASDANDGPYDHGHDFIGLLSDKVGFVDRWTGPFTD